MKLNIQSINQDKMLKYLIILAVISLGIFFVNDTFAQSTGGKNIGDLAENITKSFKQIGQLILAIAFVAGLGFVMAAIFKFKQHKDNPTQVPLGTPIAMLAIGVVLMFLPGIIKPAGETLGVGGESGGFTGQADLPGASQ